MTKERLDGLIVLLLGAVAFLVIGTAWKHVSPIEMGDFKVVYYSARCLLDHGDPYRESDVLSVYRAEGRERPTEPLLDREVKTRFFYPPTAFILTVPFALLGFGVGKFLWMILSAGSLILSAVLTWDIAADFAPLISGFLLGLLLANSFWLFMIGNSAGIAVSFCAIATWCFFRKRFVVAGILCLAISLALKPNDSGLVWLFFLMAGATLCKRALQSLAALVVLSLPVVLWVTHASPHWPQELRSNMFSFSGVGSIVDPAATGMAGRNMDSLVELQSVVSIFFSNPTTYNLITYSICLPLLLIWAIRTLRFQRTGASAWFSLAFLAPVCMLPTYHLQHDAKLLMLAVPGCIMLWDKRGRVGWLSIIITTAALIVNGDVFSGIRILLTRQIIIPQSNFASRLLTAVLTRPAPLVLLVMAAFYLWVYVRGGSQDAPQPC